MYSHLLEIAFLCMLSNLSVSFFEFDMSGKAEEV